VLFFLRESWGTTKPVQNTVKSRTNKTGDSSEVFDGREGCNKRSQRASDCSVTALQVPDGGPDEDERCLVGAIVVEFVARVRKMYEATPKGAKTRVTPATVRLIVHRYSDKGHPSNSKANRSITGRLSTMG